MPKRRDRAVQTARARFTIVSIQPGNSVLPTTHDFLTSPEAFNQFVASWEACTLPKDKWTHAAHVAIGAAYAVRYGAAALSETRAAILRYNQATGKANEGPSGYHETLTRLWSTVLSAAVEGIADPWEAACFAVDRFGEDRSLHRRYYSFDVARDPQARLTWVKPDREP